MGFIYPNEMPWKGKEGARLLKDNSLCFPQLYRAMNTKMMSKE